MQSSVPTAGVQKSGERSIKVGREDLKESLVFYFTGLHVSQSLVSVEFVTIIIMKLKNQFLVQ